MRKGNGRLYWDTEIPGFGVLVNGVSTSRTFVVQRDMPGGKTRRVTIGAVAELSLEAARQQAGDIAQDLRKGVNPKTKSSTTTLRETLSPAASHFIGCFARAMSAIGT